MDKQIAQRQAAAPHLRELADAGIMKEMPVGREKLFMHPKLLQLLTQDSNQFSTYASE